MKTILDYATTLCAQRDRVTLDLTLETVLRDIALATDCVLFGVIQVEGARWLKRRVDTVVDLRPQLSLPIDLIAEPLEIPFAERPMLANCVAQRLPQIQEPFQNTAVAIWIPVWDIDGIKLTAILRLIRSDIADTATLREIHGIVTVYRHLKQLLDDNELDSLTGLLNRKTFDRRFTELVGSVRVNPAYKAKELGHSLETITERRCHETETAHWLAVIDIDHFKSVNDQFGHVYGDEVLILLANILRTSFRDQDRVFRFGGEEFVVLLRATSLDHARTSFERLRSVVETHDFPQIKRITISLGFVSISEETPVTILGHADQALYFAKAHGRNQVCFYDELVARGQLGGGKRFKDPELF